MKRRAPYIPPWYLACEADLKPEPSRPIPRPTTRAIGLAIGQLGIGCNVYAGRLARRRPWGWLLWLRSFRPDLAHRIEREADERRAQLKAARGSHDRRP